MTKSLLLKSCRDWDVTDGYGGDKYRRSSVMGMNVPVNDDGRTLTGTGFDISDSTQFWDWMESRSAQANALLMDMARLARVRGMSRNAMSAADMNYVSRNFGERAVMALYGVDESKFGKVFTKHEVVSGERPYEETCFSIADRVASDDMDYLSSLKSRLYSFVTDWRRVNTEEKVREAIGREDGIEPLCVVRVPGQDTVMPVYSADYLVMYMSEYNGHAGYFGRMRGLAGEDIAYAYTEPGYTLFGPERKPDARVNAVWAAEWNRAQDGLKRLDGFVRDPADPDLSHDQGQYALDGARLRMSAAIDSGERSGQAGYDDSMKDRMAREAAWRARRDTSDLDMAAGEIYDSGCNSAGMDFPGPCF